MAIFFVYRSGDAGQGRMTTGPLAFAIEAADEPGMLEYLSDLLRDGEGDFVAIDTDWKINVLPPPSFASRKYRIVLTPPGGGAPAVDVTYVGKSSDVDTTTLAASIAAALNAHPLISGATNTGNTLTVAGAADNLGDHTLAVLVTMPLARRGREYPDYVGAKTHEGAAGAAVTVVLENLGTPAFRGVQTYYPR